MTVESIHAGDPRIESLHGHFADPPPPRPAPSPASAWLRHGSMLIGVIAALWVAMHVLRAAQDASSWTRLATLLGRLPAWQGLTAALVIVAVVLAAGIGVREPKARERALLALLSLVALPLVLLALLSAFWHFLG